MTTLKRKKYQRKVNRIVRDVNKAIEKDNLWRGRFVVRQKAYCFKKYEDNSGASFVVLLKYIDKKTGKTNMNSYQYFDFSFDSYVFSDMNDFIVKFCNVWGEEDRDALYNDKTDYSKIDK